MGSPFNSLRANAYMGFFERVAPASRKKTYPDQYLNLASHHPLEHTLERFSRNRQEEENTITFRLKCIVIA